MLPCFFFSSFDGHKIGMADLTMELFVEYVVLWSNS